MLDILNCFICFNFNATKAFKYQKGTKIQIYQKLYHKIRKIPNYYYFIEYEPEEFSYEKANKYYLIDESEFFYELEWSKNMGFRHKR